MFCWTQGLRAYQNVFFVCAYCCIALNLSFATQSGAVELETERYTQKSRILSRDADFENPTKGIVTSSVLMPGIFLSWEPIGGQGASLVLRNANADFGGQYIQISADGGIRQSVALDPGDYSSLNLHVRLRSWDAVDGTFYILAEIGSDATSWEVIQNPNPLQLLMPPSGSNPKQIASKDIPAAYWQTYVLRLSDVKVEAGQQIRISFFGQGVTRGAIGLDRAYLEEIDIGSELYAPNFGFEYPVIAEALPAIDTITSNTIVNNSVSPFQEAGWDEATSWPVGAPPFVLRSDGGSSGAQYLQLPGGSPGSAMVGQYNLAGAFLDPRNVFPKRDFARNGMQYSSDAYGDYDYRFALSAKARFSGSVLPVAPPTTNSDPTPAQAFFLHFEAFSCDGRVPLISRKRVPFSDLGRDFKEFALRVQPVPATRSVGDKKCFTRGKNNFDIRLSAVRPANATSNLDFDDLRLDRIAPPELYAETPWIVVGTNRNVPNWFQSVWHGQEHKNADTKFFVYLPAGVRLEKSCGKNRINTV